MANNDNVRVLYKDGLILGADELSDDQSYFRAALERRSLAGTPQGIAYGLALTQTDGRVGLTPGVAWDGNGKTVVVRQQVDVSGLLSSEQDGRYAVFLVFVEKNAASTAGHVFCGAPMDPRVEEGYRIEVTSDVPLDPGPGYRGPSRRAAQSSLPAPSDRDAGRILLGIVKVQSAANGGKALELSLGKSRIPKVDLRSPPIAERAEYAGTATAALIHPRHWTESGQAGATRVEVALELDPDHGVHVHQPAIHHSEVHFTGSDASFKLSVDKTALVLAHADPPAELLKATKDSIEILTDLKLAKSVEVTGPATFQGSVEVKGSLKISGTTIFEAVTTGDATVNGTLSAKGAAKFDDALSVAGDVTLAGAGKKLTVESQAEFKQPVIFSGGIAGVNFGALSCASLDVAGNASVVGNLKITDAFASSPIVAHGGIAIQANSGVPLAKGTLVTSTGATPTSPAKVVVTTVTIGTTAIGIMAFTGANVPVVIVSGYAEAFVDNVSASTNPGDWLCVNMSGRLEPSSSPTPGTMVAKLLSKNQLPNMLYPVLVSLG